MSKGSELVDPFCVENQPQLLTFEDVSSAAFKIKGGIINTPCVVENSFQFLSLFIDFMIIFLLIYFILIYLLINDKVSRCDMADQKIYFSNGQ